MVFWIIPLAVIVVALAVAWLYDRRREAPAGGVTGPENDPAANAARVERGHRPGDIGPTN